MAELKLPPREYANLRGMKPQLVYYHIRQGHVDMEKCLCGRSVIDVEKADMFFGKEQHGQQLLSGE